MDINKPSHNFLHTFCIKPNFHFQTQGDHEEVILVVRAHPFSQIPWLLNSIFILILLITLSFFISGFLNPIQILFAFSFSIIITIAYGWLNVLIWFFNVGIITNERIIDIDFHAVIYKEITEARLDRIQDVTEKAGGFFESYLDYGNLFIQTAGGEQNIEFFDVPYPASVVKIIHNLTERGRHQ